jgi:hypothetical protein
MGISLTFANFSADEGNSVNWAVLRCPPGSTAITAACGILQNYTNVALAIDANATFIRGSLANYNLTLPAAVGTLSTWVLFVQVRAHPKWAGGRGQGTCPIPTLHTPPPHPVLPRVTPRYPFGHSICPATVSLVLVTSTCPGAK